MIGFVSSAICELPKVLFGEFNQLLQMGVILATPPNVGIDPVLVRGVSFYLVFL